MPTLVISANKKSRKRMPSIDVEVLKKARTGCVAISLFNLLNFTDAVTARLFDRVPSWLESELANEGVAIVKDRSGQWFLEPLSI
jgi:hypothetical protein